MCFFNTDTHSIVTPKLTTLGQKIVVGFLTIPVFVENKTVELRLQKRFLDAFGREKMTEVFLRTTPYRKIVHHLRNMHQKAANENRPFC